MTKQIFAHLSSSCTFFNSFDHRCQAKYEFPIRNVQCSIFSLGGKRIRFRKLPTLRAPCRFVMTAPPISLRSSMENRSVDKGDAIGRIWLLDANPRKWNKISLLGGREDRAAVPAARGLEIAGVGALERLPEDRQRQIFAWGVIQP